MIQVCYICWRVYGEKAPLENKEETSGICPDCLPGEWEKLRKWEENQTLKLKVINVPK